MKYSLFGNDELGWTVVKNEGKNKFFSFDENHKGKWHQLLEFFDLTTKEKAEAKLKELQDGNG